MPKGINLLREHVKRIAAVEHDLHEWQRWHLTTRLGGGYVIPWLLERVDCSRPLMGGAPIKDEEVIFTDMAVASLREPLKRTVLTVYLDREGNSAEGIARILGVHERTVHNRLCHADFRIMVWKDERRESRRKAA